LSQFLSSVASSSRLYLLICAQLISVLVNSIHTKCHIHSSDYGINKISNVHIT